MKRLLVTGSRTWWDSQTIIRALTDAVFDLGGADIVLVHGGAKGADILCRDVMRYMGFPDEEHRADWKTFGRSAGYRRNQEMADLGADLCLAFILDESKGATMLAEMAQRAGIETRIYRASSEENIPLP